MSLTDLIAYYVNLLIIQYHNKPKAQATIQLFAKEMLASDIFNSIQNAYDIDTAVGVQLDVIGKYVGVDRYYSGLNLSNYFSLETYDESAPTSPPRWGFCDYSNYDVFAYNGTLIYDEIITFQNALFDEDFRILIKLKILINSINFSHKSIDDGMFEFFGTQIRPESTGNMTMVYFLSLSNTQLVQAILTKKLLPKPMAVLLMTVDSITGDMFSLADYSGNESPFGYGFTDYADYDTLPGEILTYSQISAG